MDSNLLSFLNIDDNENDYSDITLSNFTICLVVLSFLIFLVGFIGNIVVIFIIVTLKEYKKSSTHWYILQLAISNFLFLATTPFHVTEDINQAWIFPEWMCKAKQTILAINFYASIMFLTVMSVDRYVAVCHPSSKLWGKIKTKTFARKICIAVWTICVLLSIPMMLYSIKAGTDPKCNCIYKFPSGQDPCTEDKNSSLNHISCIKFVDQHCQTKLEAAKASIRLIKAIFANPPAELDLTKFSGDGSYDDESEVTEKEDDQDLGCSYETNSSLFVGFITFEYVGIFIIPFLVMLVCYGLIIKKIRKSTLRTRTWLARSSASTNQSHESRRERDQDRITKTCVLLIVSFFLSWVLHQTFRFAKLFEIPYLASETCVKIFEVGSVLGFLNAAINPYLYSFIGMNFTERFRKASSTFRNSVSRARTSSTASNYEGSRTRSRNNSRTNPSSGQKAPNKTLMYLKRSDRQGSTSGSGASDSLSGYESATNTLKYHSSDKSMINSNASTLASNSKRESQIRREINGTWF